MLLLLLWRPKWRMLLLDDGRVEIPRSLLHIFTLINVKEKRMITTPFFFKDKKKRGTIFHLFMIFDSLLIYTTESFFPLTCVWNKTKQKSSLECIQGFLLFFLCCVIVPFFFEVLLALLVHVYLDLQNKASNKFAFFSEKEGLMVIIFPSFCFVLCICNAYFSNFILSIKKHGCPIWDFIILILNQKCFLRVKERERKGKTRDLRKPPTFYFPFCLYIRSLCYFSKVNLVQDKAYCFSLFCKLYITM